MVRSSWRTSGPVRYRWEHKEIQEHPEHKEIEDCQEHLESPEHPESPESPEHPEHPDQLREGSSLPLTARVVTARSRLAR